MLYSTVLFAFALAGTALANDFAASCSNFRLSTHYFTANCGNGSGGYRDSTMDMNLCVGNEGNNLVAQNDGGYYASASGCYMSGTYMRCICGGTTRCEIDLNAVLGNQGGHLVCPYHYGTKREPEAEDEAQPAHQTAKFRA